MEASKESNSAPPPPPAPAPAPAQCEGQGQEVQIPTQSSPYVQYENLEDYKMTVYGTQGHLPTVDPPRQAGATDSPTPPGSATSALRDQ